MKMTFGDVLVALMDSLDITADKQYRVLAFDQDGDPVVKDDAGERCAHSASIFAVLGR